MIYLIDDYMPQNGIINFDEYLTCLKTHKSVPLDEEDDIWQDEEAIFFYHSSLEEAYVIREFVGEYKVPYIAFSGARNDEPEKLKGGWLMKRSIFYSHLKYFLDRYKNDNSLSIECFLDEPPHKTITLQKQLVEEQSDNVIRLNQDFLLKNPININKPLEVEEYVKEHFSGKKIIVFDLDAEKLTPTVVHYLGAYIRLSLDIIKEAALASFIFKGKENFIDYIKKFQELECQDILLWPGSIFKSSEDIDLVKDVPQLTPSDYIEKFLKHLKITPKGNTGNHTIANYWGAYVVARHLPDFEEQTKKLYHKALERDSLYLKYLLASRISNSDELDKIIKNVSEQIEIIKIAKDSDDNNKYKLLLVDDQDDIWKDVIERLFPNCDITVIGKSSGIIETEETNFLSSEAYDNNILSSNYDVILLDLRLGGDKEENIVNGDLCSGMKILNQIIEKNPGQQVIMFTSSNKAWNLKKALSKASGYYIKESPLQLFSEKETTQNIENFIEMAKKCLWYSDLRNVVSEIESLKKKTSVKYNFELVCNRNGKQNVRFKLRNDFYGADDDDPFEIIISNIKEQLSIVKSMAIWKTRDTSVSKDDWTYEYIALIQILEIAKRLNPLIKQNESKRSLALYISGISVEGSNQGKNWVYDKTEYDNKYGVAVYPERIKLKALISLRNDLVHRHNISETDDFYEEDKDEDLRRMAEREQATELKKEWERQRSDGSIYIDYDGFLELWDFIFRFCDGILE